MCGLGERGLGERGLGDVGLKKVGLGVVGLADMGRGYENVGTRGMGTRGREKQTSPDFCSYCVKYNFLWRLEVTGNRRKVHVKKPKKGSKLLLARYHYESLISGMK